MKPIKQNVKNGSPERWYVVGDIHGEITALNKMLVEIESHKVNNPHENSKVIFVGDYIDRGESSFLVLERLIQYKKDHPETVFLMGNHEMMLFESPRDWLRNGGDVVRDEYAKINLDGVEAADTYARMEFVGHLDFIKNLDYYYAMETCDGIRIVVHGGLSPYYDLDEQIVDDLVWYRPTGLVTQKRDETHPLHNIKYICGHTPVKEVIFDEEKCMLDTGCVFGHSLSCVIFDSDKPFDTYKDQIIKTKKVD